MTFSCYNWTLREPVITIRLYIDSLTESDSVQEELGSRTSAKPNSPAFISCFARTGYEYTGAVTVFRKLLVRRLASLAITCLTLLPLLVQAEADRSIHLVASTWNKDQDLPDDSVTSILQTRDGYLWVGTPSGLARFDGMKFTVISPEHWKSNATVSVTALCEDSLGNLWVGTQGSGLLCYQNGVLSASSEHSGLRSVAINSIADTGAALWIGTPSGLFRLQGERLTQFTKADGLPNDFIYNVHLARSGTLWITTRGGICEFQDGQLKTVPIQTDSPSRSPESLGVYEDHKGNQWAFGETYLVNLTDGKHLNHFGIGDAASTRIWSFCEGQNGELWIGTSGRGLYCFIDDEFEPLTLDNGELNSDVRAICEDRQGNLWLGTQSDGLVRLQLRSIHILDTSAGLPSRPAICLAFNPNGRAWVDFDHGGLYKSAADGFERFSDDALPSLQNLVSSICVAQNSNVWIGTVGAGLYCISGERCLHLTTADGFSENNILSLATDSDGTVWIGTTAGLYRTTNNVLTAAGEAGGLSDESISAISPARKGGVWLGLSDGVVLRESRGQFHRVSKVPALSGKAIRALYEDSAERLWIGTAGGSLGCVADDHFLNWDLPAASPERSILGIIVTDDGDLWVSTGRSIYSASQKDVYGWLSGQEPLVPRLILRTNTVFGTGPGYGWPHALKSPDGTLWFAMDNGIVTINSAGGPSDSAPPPVLIEEISVNGNLLSPVFVTGRKPFAAGKSTARLRLPSDLRKLEIHFTGLDLSSPEKLRFRYRLDGLDNDWVVDNDPRREATYNTLKYGSYTFHVQAGNADQTWFENEASFVFLVPTPLWRTSWALALYGITGFLLAVGIARMVSARRFRRRLAALAAQQAMERERMRIARDMHDEIGSKLTKISFMSERAKRELQTGESVAQKLDSIAGTSRDLLQTLDEIVWAVNPHNDTLEHLAAYLGQYATEYLQNTAVECELHIPRGLPHYPLSAEARHNLFLAFEESLNNALKHGRPARVSVRMDVTSAQFEIRISDDGCGFVSDSSAEVRDENGATSGHSRNGLQNMCQRLELLGGTCHVQSRPGHGTTVVLTVPLAPQTATKSNGTK